MFDELNNFPIGLITGWITALPLLIWLFGEKNAVPRLLNWRSNTKYRKNKENYRLDMNRQGDVCKIRNIGKKTVKIIDITFSSNRTHSTTPILAVSQYIDEIKAKLREFTFKPYKTIDFQYIYGDFSFKITYSNLSEKYKDDLEWRTDII